jgi:hypothetical protein
MLLGGKGGCQQCTCVPCDECTRTCQNPHTGDAFEAVYTRYFEGAEAGNVSDGYLTASGDSDTSDPYNGMDGLGPWFQQITGGFTLNSTQTRFPCRVTVSFWRNSYTLGAATIPPASTALTSEKVYIEVETGAVILGNQQVITPEDGEVEIETASIPLVSGGGDQSENIPRFYEGSISVAPQCESASFSVRARIEWNTQKRQHVLYGIVRECYEIGTPCSAFCSGSPANNVLYLTISNYTGPEPASGSPNGTYVLERVPNYCDFFLGGWLWGCAPGLWLSPYVGGEDEVRATKNFISAGSWQIINGECKILLLLAYSNSSVDKSYCGTGVLHSGEGVIYVHTRLWGALPEDIVSGSFDWEIST